VQRKASHHAPDGSAARPALFLMRPFGLVLPGVRIWLGKSCLLFRRENRKDVIDRRRVVLYQSSVQFRKPFISLLYVLNGIRGRWTLENDSELALPCTNTLAACTTQNQRHNAPPVKRLVAG
jgi:hypothetical protein